MAWRWGEWVGGGGRDIWTTLVAFISEVVLGLSLVCVECVCGVESGC